MPWKNSHFILALIAMWLLGGHACPIAAAFAGTMPAACECAGEDSHDGTEDAACDDCAPCLTRDNGMIPAALVPVAAPSPTCRALADLIQWLQSISLQEMEQTVEADSSPPPPMRSVWPEFVRKGRPVRGPSTLA